MPVYEYGCKKCRKTFEYLQRITDPPKKKCEACGGALERLISQTSFQLKGSGWYKDLYSSSKPSSGGSDGASGESGSSSSASSESSASATPAPAAATETKPKKKKAK